MMVAVMAVLMPTQAVIPVHGLVQIGSNAGRTAIMLGGVQWQVLAPFCAGSLVGAAVGGMTVVALDPAVLNIGPACFIQIGRASCRERVCQTVSISVAAVSLQKKHKKRK